MKTTCPCCRTAPPPAGGSEQAELHCPACDHVWRSGGMVASYYAACAGRNEKVPGLAQKYADRMNSVAPLLHPGMRILEIGCADGVFGTMVKSRMALHYAGIEISPDAALAERNLDRIHRRPAADLDDAPYDLLLSFHVLEHLQDVHAELAHWRRLMKPYGRLTVEVPHRAGHPLLENDRHPEHIHQFSPASLAILLGKAGFTPTRISTGHFESTVYSDSLRIEAQVTLIEAQKTERLLARIKTYLPGPLVVYGVGGDFRNYVEFLLPHLQVIALCDADPACHGRIIGEHPVQAYDPAALAGLPVLIASTRHEAEIRRTLQATGLAESSIVGLGQIYG